VTPVNILKKGKAIARVPLLVGVIWNSNNLMRGTNRVILGTDMLQEGEAGVLTFERLGQKIEHCTDDDEPVLVRNRCRKACAIELNEALGERKI
jgi:serine/threonine-protein kinase BUR1